MLHESDITQRYIAILAGDTVFDIAGNKIGECDEKEVRFSPMIKLTPECNSLLVVRVVGEYRSEGWNFWQLVFENENGIKTENSANPTD